MPKCVRAVNMNLSRNSTRWEAAQLVGLVANLEHILDFPEILLIVARHRETRNLDRATIYER